MLNMEHRIWIEKVCVVTRLMNTRVEDENYAREILSEQLEQGWEGLTTEVSPYLPPDLTTKHLPSIHLTGRRSWVPLSFIT